MRRILRPILLVLLILYLAMYALVNNITSLDQVREVYNQANFWIMILCFVIVSLFIIWPVNKKGGGNGEGE